MIVHRPSSLLRDPEALVATVSRRLESQRHRVEMAPLSAQKMAQSSAVLFLLISKHSPSGSPQDRSHEPNGGCPGEGLLRDGVHLILNKRSAAVRQGGDLCCPGGGIAPTMDRFLGALLRLPRSPLTAWPQWAWWYRHRPTQTHRLAMLLGTALREGFEEMRLNPLGVRFLGPLPAERLVVFKKEIYPFVGWVGRQRRFYPNWEVADLVYLPLEALLDPGNYARLRYRFNTAETHRPKGDAGEMPCYIHRSAADSDPEVLWGVTFRITMRFLDLTFGFRPPPMAHLPEVMRDLDDTYANGTNDRRMASAVKRKPLTVLNRK